MAREDMSRHTDFTTWCRLITSAGLVSDQHLPLGGLNRVLRTRSRPLHNFLRSQVISATFLRRPRRSDLVIEKLAGMKGRRSPSV